jgi:hypothetical protein
MYRQAAFALEEVLSMGVLAPLTLIKYADVLSSIGGAERLRTARAYYAKALQVRYHITLKDSFVDMEC